jgi:beta-glucosidase-like glycosyl hydrolase
MRDILNSMTLEEKVGQLFVAPISPLREEDHWSDWETLLKTIHIGNAILKQSDPERQIEVLNRLQASSNYPLLITADAEWGLAMRMTDTIAFPRNMTLGAIQDLSLLEQLGAEIARQARLVGIHMNFAPVVDVNNNPANPIIHMRSFGEDPKEVAKRGEAIIAGFRRGGLLACAKHFPGHGNTSVDSHQALPLIDQPLASLNSTELPPFKMAIDSNIPAIMTAHILIPSLDPKSPATLSSSILTTLLRGTLQFNGLIVTDALNMKALSGSTEEIALQAHAAGADLLLYGAHLFEDVNQLLRDTVPRAYKALLSAYQKRQFPQSKLDQSVLRILRAKEASGLFANRLLAPNPPLNTPKALALKQTLFQEAIVQLGLPFTPIDASTLFLDPADPLPDLSFTPQAVVSLKGIKPNAEAYGLTPETLSTLHTLATQTHLIICLYGTPYTLSLLPQNATLLVAFEDDPCAVQAVMNILYGRQKAKGRLPIGEPASKWKAN